MPLFFFHVRGGVQRTDREGVELVDVNAAWVEALRYAEDIQTEPGSGLRRQRWSVVVNDGAGRFVFQLDIDETS